MNARFYNAGYRIDETIAFSLPEGGDIHYIGRWPLHAPKEDWFDVPSELEVQNTTVSVQFIRDIKQKFGPRGVALLDPLWDPAKEDPELELWKYPLAPTEELVVERAQKLWNLYLRKVVEGHLADCQSAMAAGGAPRAASGFTRNALKALNIQDPGEQYFLNLQKGQLGTGAGVSDDVKAILAQQGQMMNSMMAIVVALASGEKLDPAALKASIEPAKMPDSLTTGVMTGKVAKPVDMRGSGPDAEIFDRKVKGRKDRSEAAVAAL